MNQYVKSIKSFCKNYNDMKIIIKYYKKHFINVLGKINVISFNLD